MWKEWNRMKPRFRAPRKPPDIPAGNGTYPLVRYNEFTPIFPFRFFNGMTIFRYL